MSTPTLRLIASDGHRLNPAPGAALPRTQGPMATRRRLAALLDEIGDDDLVLVELFAAVVATLPRSKRIV